MAKLTGVKAVQHLHYVERQRAAGKMTERLAEIEQHRLEFLKRTKCCTSCGRKIDNRESLKAWQVDGLGPECRRQMAEAS